MLTLPSSLSTRFRAGTSGAIGHIDLHSHRRNTDGPQFGEHLLAFLSVAAKHSDGSSGFGQSQRNAAADSTVPAGNDGHLAGQVK